MKAIDWPKWSAIAEILSAIAILITLLYLAVQTRYLAVQNEQNTRALLATAQQGLLEREMEALDHLVDYPELVLSALKPDATVEELTRLYAWLSSLARVRESLYRQYQLGVINEASYQRAEFVFLFLLGTERVQNWWSNSRGAFDPDFVERIDSEFRAIETQPVDENFIESAFQRAE